MPFAPDHLLTSHDAGNLLQVDPTSVVKWINDGLISAYRTPGGHRRIRAGDLAAFARKANMFVPPELQGGLRVALVSDDEATTRDVFRAASQRGQVSVEACDTFNALIRLGARQADALVLDAGANGLAALKAVRANPITAEAAAVLVTDRVTPELEKQAKALRARAVLSKPVAPEALLAALTAK